MTRSYYSNSITDFITDDGDKILGKLTKNHSFATENLQRNAWIKQIDILKTALKPFANGQIYFEFSIPRMGKRVDNILIINDFIFVIEFNSSCFTSTGLFCLRTVSGPVSLFAQDGS